MVIVEQPLLTPSAVDPETRERILGQVTNDQTLEQSVRNARADVADGRAVSAERLIEHLAQQPA